MTSAYHENRSCIICGAVTSTVLDLKSQPLANALLEKQGDLFEAYPLGFSYCPKCSHGQLTHFIDPRLLFTHYLYSSGTSTTLKSFFDWFAKCLGQSEYQDKRILEIASNDGSLLDSLKVEGFSVSGIDPASNLCDIARKKGHDIKCGFFPDCAPDEPADIIVAMNVMAHNPDPVAFMKGILDHLSDDGIALIQTSQANMIVNGEFDTIYHEHYSFFTRNSMRCLAEAVGMELVDLQLCSVHGTSFIFKLRKKNSDALVPVFGEVEGVDFTLEPSPKLLPLLGDDVSADEFGPIYSKFADDADAVMRETKLSIDEYRLRGFKIALLGVAAKALTFIHASGIEPDLYFDEAPLKIGRYVPGALSSIRSLQDLVTVQEDICILIGAWNFADELSRKVVDLTEKNGFCNEIELITYLPSLRKI